MSFLSYILRYRSGTDPHFCCFFYNQFTYSKDAIHTEGVIVIPSGTPVILTARVKMVRGIPRCLSSDARLHANFQFEYWQHFYEGSEGDKVNVYYSPGHPKRLR